MLRILIINGPNLNLLGYRETSVYGDRTLDQILNDLRNEFPSIMIDDLRSNEEGAIITAIQEARVKNEGIVINAGGYSHTSIAIRDALAAVKIPAVEIHISNLLAREPFRHVSIIGAVCTGSIMGLGAKGYSLAIRFLLDHVEGKRSDPADRTASNQG